MSVLDISAEEYHGNVKYLTNSKLLDFRERGPLFFYKAHIEKSIPREETRAMTVGSAFDDLFFDYRGQDFDKRYAVRPFGMNFRTKEGKAWKEAVENETPKRSIITHDDNEMMKKMLAAMREHPFVSKLMAGASTQVTLTMELKEHGLQVAGRPDALNIGMGCIWDLKTTDDLANWYDWMDPESPLNGSRVFKMGYHRQGGIYQKLAAQNDLVLPDFYLAVVEKKEPYRVAVFKLSDDYLDIGWLAVRHDIDALAVYHKAGQWPKLPLTSPDVIQLAPAQWMEAQAAREFSETL